MLAYPPVSINFKMYVQSSFIYPLCSLQSLTSITISKYIHSTCLFTTKFTKQSLHYPPRIALAILRASAIVHILEYFAKSLNKL